MRKRSIAVACATGALLAPAVALAGTNTFSTSLKRGAKTTGTLSFKIQTNGEGTATKVTAIKVSGLKTRCVDENGTIKENGPVVTGSIGSADIKTPKETGSRFYSFDKVKRSGGLRIGVRGLLSRRAPRVTGEAYANNNSTDCSGRGSYKATKK